MRQIGVVMIWMILSAQVLFAQVLLIQQKDSGSAKAAARQIEASLSDWFFERELLAISEQNPVQYVGIELAQFMANQMNAKAIILWSIDADGTFLMTVYSVEGRKLGEHSVRLSIRDANLGERAAETVDSLLLEAMQELGLV